MDNKDQKSVEEKNKISEMYRNIFDKSKQFVLLKNSN